MAQIGIKLADHSFYPVLTNEEPQKKRMVLTVARDGQHSVQVDLIRRSDEGDQFIGCLVLEDLPDDAARELEFQIDVDRSGTIDAHIKDRSGEHFQSFSASLSHPDVPEAIGLPNEPSDVEDIRFAMPDPVSDVDLEDTEIFDGEEDLHAAFAGELAADLSEEIENDDVEEYDDEEQAQEQSRRPFNFIVLIAIILITVSVVMVGAYFVFTALRGDALPELRSALAHPVRPDIFFA